MRHIELELRTEVRGKDKKQLENSLHKIKGVDCVRVNGADGIVKVDYDLPATEKEIIDQVANGGHKIKF